MPATIKLGSASPDVTTWQSALASAGFPVAITGTFDQATADATKAWQGAKGLTADGIVGPASWGAMTGAAQAGKPDKNAQFGRDALLAAWPGVTGETPSLAELQIAGAQARLESGYGKGSYQLLDHASTLTNKIPIGPSSGVINNWGAIQGGSAADGTGYLATDSGPSHITPDNPIGWYDHHYRIYATPAEGAAAIVKEMTVRRPTSWALMKAGDIDAWAKQMWAGVLPNGQLNRDPLPPVGAAEGSKGTLGYFEQKPDQRAKTIASHVADIAFTLNEPIAAKRGGPMPAGGLQPEDGGGGLTWSSDSSPAQKGFFALLLAGLAAGAFRVWKGHWPWPF